MGTIVVTEKLPEPELNLLTNRGYEVVYNATPSVTAIHLLEMIQDASGIIVSMATKLNADTLRQASELKAISTFSTGTDHIDLDYCKEAGITVTNIPGDVVAEPTADLAWALLLAAARNVVVGDELARSGNWGGARADQPAGVNVGNRTIGVIGMGNLGKEVAQRALGFSMEILYYSRTKHVNLEKYGLAEYVELEDLMRASDFVVMCLPLTPETKNFIGEDQLSLMKPDAILVNVGRGATLDNHALINALDKEQLRGAALDVYPEEPFVEYELRSNRKVTLSPHCGSATKQTRAKMVRMVSNDLISVLDGKSPLYKVV